MNQAPTIDTSSAMMPKIGFGTYYMEGDACVASVASALDAGYRLLDCAEIYENETEVGEAIRVSSVGRDDLFVISKFWFTHNHPDEMRRALDGSLERMGLDRFDLYMLHWPSQDMDLPALLEALEREKADGRIGAVGLCNFPLSWLKELVAETPVAIDAVELEWHVYLDQGPAQQFLASRGIPLIAYCPLAQGRVAHEPILAEIADRHGVNPAAVALAWLISHEGVTAIPKAASSRHQIANLEALRVRLSQDEMLRIAQLPKDVRLANFPFSPPWD